MELNDLFRECAEKRKQGKNIVLCHGVFDVVHAGHIQHLREAKSYGDILVVTLTPDKYVRKGPGRPIFNQQTRASVVEAIKYVDLVAVNNSPEATDVLEAVRPDVYCKGEEVLICPSGYIIKEREFVESYGGRVVLLGMVGDLSSSKVINQTSLNPDLTRLVTKVKDLASYSDIENYFAELRDLRVLVIGEFIQDEYVLCNALNRSSKDVMVPMQYLGEKIYAGGAAVVARNIAQFCDNVSLITCGDNFVLDGISTYLCSHPTIRKRRLVEEGTGNKVAELIYLNEDYKKDTQRELEKFVTSLSSSMDIVVACDYGHGLFTKDLIGYVIGESPFLAVNVQTNSANFGYNLATRWYDADYAVIDEKELHLASSDRRSAIGDLAVNLDVANILTVTLGHKGSVTYQGGGFVGYFPPISSSVVDTVGAGDAFLSITAPLVAVGMPLEVVGLLGNAYGAMKVSIFGNNPVNPVEFKQFIKGILA